MKKNLDIKRKEKNLRKKIDKNNSILYFILFYLNKYYNIKFINLSLLILLYNNIFYIMGIGDWGLGPQSPY